MPFRIWFEFVQAGVSLCQASVLAARHRCQMENRKIMVGRQMFSFWGWLNFQGVWDGIAYWRWFTST